MRVKMDYKRTKLNNYNEVNDILNQQGNDEAGIWAEAMEKMFDVDGETLQNIIVSKMLDSISHRGPDGEGKAHIKGQAIFGHKRSKNEKNMMFISSDS